jgi:HSP20 family protein
MADMDPFTALHRDVNRLFDDVLRGFGGAASAGPLATAAPRMDVSETADSIDIAVELTGISEKGVEVQLVEDVLTIRGEKKGRNEDKQQSYHVVERSFGSFVRSVRLPLAVDPGQVQASFENGVLHVRLPKSAAQQRTHRIEVKAGAAAGGSSAQKQQQDHPAADGGGNGNGSADPTAQAMARASDQDGGGAERQPS